MRYYRLAIPVTYSAYVEDLGGDYNNVLQFWSDCEEFANRMFVPLGICFDVVEDQRLVKTAYFPNEGTEDFIYTLQSNGTSNTNDLIGEDSYDVGMWVHHRGVELDNSGLSAEGGVYSSIAKGSGYSKTDKWVVAHELGHIFGAPHTTTGEGSLMDSGGDDFFSYPSIKKIRERAVEEGAGSANNAIKVSNNAPVFNNANMKDSYRIPQGACIAIPVYANDADGNILTYSAIGCSSSTVGNIVEGGVMPHFASVVPQTDNVIDYRPKFTADIVYDDFYYEQDGTNIPAMNAGSYNIAILVNDVPASMEYDYLTANPFYSNYAVWDATVQIVGGTSFNALMSPAKNSYSAGEQVTVSWGVNSNYFTADSRLRITMSTDYGKTFAYVLADNVPALDGSKAVTLPDVNVGNIDVDFKTATRSMRGGIIRVEEIGGVAYTLTTLSPTDGKGFNITGGSGAPMTYTINVTAGDGGTASIDGKSSTTVAAGSSVTLTATPNDGYIFDAWYSGGRFVSLEAEYTFTPTASGTYNALFEKEASTPVTYKITATASPAAGGTATVNGSTSATVEANGTIELSAKANDGYTFVNWTSGGKEVTTQADYKIYNVTGDADYIANFKLETTATEYPTPTGNTYTDNYLTSITTTGGDTNIGYSANAHPGQSLVVVPGKVQLEKGQSFTMNLIAKSLGAGSNSVIREDMRYCHASLFTDFDQDFTFEASPVQTWGVKGPSGTNPYAGGNSNVYGNYDLVMNITHTITVPDDAPTGESHVRMIYTNAWKDWPANGTANLDKGIVYDIVVEVVEKVDITAAGYYRFKCVGSGKYLSSEVNITYSNRLAMGGENSIFYYDESSLLAYTEGLYVGVSKTESIYNVTLSDVAASPVVTEVISSDGAYYISLGGMNEYGNGIRYIYGNADEADSGTQDEGFPADDGYKWDVEEITALPVKIGKTGWATIYAPVALEIPTGVEAYYVEKENFEGNWITLTAIKDNVIPASMGVILYAEEAVGEEKIYNFAITESSSLYNTNLLEGSVARTYVDLEAYVLSEQDGHVGLYKAEMNLLDNKAFLNNSHKAYLPVAGLEEMATSSGWRFNIEGNGVTAINKIQNEVSDNEIYDLTGRKVHSISIPGIYISNGKKIFVR